MVDRLIAEGVEGFFVGGSTGEGVSQTVPERQTVARAFVEATAGRVPVIVQVGRDCLEEARILARHAHDIGADAISAVSPCYFTPPTVEVLVSCLERITSARARPAVLLLSHPSPQRCRVRDARLPPRGARADSLPRRPEVQRHRRRPAPGPASIRRHPTCASSTDRTRRISPGSPWGLTAPSAAPTTSWRPCSRAARGLRASDLDRARRLQGRAVEIIHAILPLGGLSALKATMRRIDLDCGPTRLPLPPLGKEREKELDRALDALDFDRLRQGETA